jgi:nucleoid-associated protein YgaU
MTYGKSSEMDEMEALRAENNTLKAGRAESMKVAARLSRTQAELKACKLDLWSKEEQLLDARAAFETRGIQHLDAAMTKIKQLRVDRAAAVKRAEAAEAQVHEA